MADTKITALPANTTPLSTDVTVLIDDPGGTPVSQKITLANLMALFANPVSDDGDGLGTLSLQWADLFLAAGGAITWDGLGGIFDSGGTLTIDLPILHGRTFQADGGDASNPPILIPAQTLMTTPSDGALEADATNFYGTTDAGNRGYIPVRHFIRAASNRTYASNTNPQTMFNSPANGRLTLETGTYLIRGHLGFTGMSGTSGNLQVLLLGGGSATIANALVAFHGQDAATGAAGAVGGSWTASMSSSASVVTAATATQLSVAVVGSFEVTAAGTLQPQIDMVTAAASSLIAGSYLEIWRIGPTGVVSVGQWD